MFNFDKFVHRPLCNRIMQKSWKYFIPGLSPVVSNFRCLSLSYMRKELLTLREHPSSSPVFCGVRVAHLFSFRCWVFCFAAMSCVPSVASVSGLSIRDFSFDVSNVY